MTFIQSAELPRCSCVLLNAARPAWSHHTARCRPGPAPGARYHSRGSLCAMRSLNNGAVKFPSQESVVDAEQILRDASAMGQDFVFEDTDEQTEVWELEARLAREPPAETLQEPQVKRALDPEQRDILSAYSSEQGFQEMTVDQLKQQLDIGADQLFVLDVRSAWEFSRGRVPGATNISMDDLSSKVKAGELDSVRDRTIAVVCAAGIRSAQAAVRLHKVFGFQNVVNVKGGTTEWIKSGFEVSQ